MTRCQCGRSKLHCPHCGYAGLAGQAKLTRAVDGVTIYSYRCRKCSRVFDDLSLSLCKAPHIAEDRSHKIAAKVDDALKDMSFDERKRWVAAKLHHEPFVPKEPSVADEIDASQKDKE